MDHDPDRPNFFAGPYVDRRADARETSDWHAAALSDPTTLYLIARDTLQLVRTGPEPTAVFVTRDHPTVRAATARQLVLLGWYRGARCVLLELESEHELVPPVPDARFEELRPLANVLPADDAALLAYARGLSIWRSRHRYCGVCSAPLEPVRAGHALRCTDDACAHESFPRLDPAIIVLVSDGERALLGRQSSWPEGRYSTLAGFVEPGESLEDAVRREVLEETGVPIQNVRYHSSQPWPFPSSLMIGFKATASPDSPIRIGSELDHVRWFTRAEFTSGQVPLPPSRAISYRLIREWLAHPEPGVPTAL